MAAGCIYTYNGKEHSENEFKNLLLSGELDDLLPKEVVDELPVVEKKTASVAKKETAPASVEPKAKSKLAKFKEKHLSQSKTENNATKKREVSESSQQQHKGTEGIRIPTETSRSHSNEQSRESKKEIVPDVVVDNPALKDVESTTKAIEGLSENKINKLKGTIISNLDGGEKLDPTQIVPEKIAEYYHKIKGYNFKNVEKNPIVKAVEQYLSEEQSLSTQEVKAEQPSNKQELNEAERAEKIESLKAEKQQKVNEVTKPEIIFDTGLSLTDLAGTSEANRQLHDDYKSQLASLKNMVNCLWQ